MQTADLIDTQTGEVTPSQLLVDIDAVDANLAHLLTLYQSAKLSADDLSAAIKTTAEKAGVHPAALRRYVSARASEKYQEKRAEAAQLQLMFEEIA